MFRVPTWKPSTCSPMASASSTHSTSEISGSPVSRRASSSRGIASRPMPWKLSGLVRGLNTPARSASTPRSDSACACSTYPGSTEHGPAMSPGRPTPMGRFPMRTARPFPTPPISTPTNSTRLPPPPSDGRLLPAYGTAFFQQVVWTRGPGGGFASGFFPASLLGLHMEPLLVVPALLERAWPDARLLGVLDAVALGAAAPAAYLFLDALLGRPGGWLAAALAAPVPLWAETQWAAWAGFHTEALA